MSERLPAPLCLISAVLLLSACGNKADLFLPEDPQLAEDFDSVSNTDAVPGAVPVPDAVPGAVPGAVPETLPDSVTDTVNDNEIVEDPADSDKPEKRTPDEEDPLLPGP